MDLHRHTMLKHGERDTALAQRGVQGGDETAPAATRVLHGKPVQRDVGAGLDQRYRQREGARDPEVPDESVAASCKQRLSFGPGYRKRHMLRADSNHDTHGSFI